MIRRLVDRLFGVDAWFFWKIGIRSRWLRLRCVLLGGHTHEWIQLHGGGGGWDALMCTRCHCHISEWRETSPVSESAP